MNMEWQYAWTKPQITGDLKTSVQDFFVEEELDFKAEGKGEFLYLFVEKQGINTDYLAKLLSKHAGIPENKITYSGVKDRHAVTRQWFCLHVLNENPDFSDFMSDVGNSLNENESVRIITQVRHLRKLKVGAHQKNRFVIRLRRLEGAIEELQDRLALVALEGVPNYFGPQRFGIAGNNLVQGANWLSTPRSSKRRLSKTESFWVSAIRSWFFNRALSDQIDEGIWSRIFLDDRAQLQGTQSQCKVNEIDAPLLKRLHQMDIHPLMPLPYIDALNDTSTTRSNSMKKSWQKQEEVFASLITLGFSREERCTRLYPENMEWEIVDSQLILQFSLPKGSFATSVLRELIDFNDCSGVDTYENIDCK